MVERKAKLIVGDFGYVLEDIPHLSDYISSLPEYRNPLQLSPAYSVVRQYFVDPDDSVTQKILVDENAARGTHFRRAGPREKVCFMPEEVNACIVTPGGLCPGLNTLIRELVYGLYQMYGVTKVTGIHGGYKGFSGPEAVRLTPEVVHDIHKVGGTVLGSSREEQDTMTIVDCIQEKGFNQVYIIGGYATLQQAASVYEEIEKRQLKVSVVGIPRCIDNDIKIIDKSFGFDTVVEEAQRAIKEAHVEAESVENGVGVVKLMGCHSGFIAMYSSLASRDVDCCLIPESPFFLEGKGGLLEFLERRLRENGHLVIVLSEGTGRNLILESMKAILQEDSSAKLPDVGLWLSERIKKYFKIRKIDLNLKYIDPTYMIRAVRSNASDNVYCTLLAHSALHGAMAGYTGFCVGPVNGKHAYIPIHLLLESTNQVCITDRMWARLLSSTEQPSFMD